MIICAALKVEACEDFEEIVEPCFRHGNGYEILQKLSHGAKYKGHVTEGFITNKGDFLDRGDALQHAMDCGQLSATTRELKRREGETYELYSEDLY